MIKRLAMLIAVFCLLLVGCASVQATDGENTTPFDVTVNNDTAVTEQIEEPKTIMPLPDNTMENLTDAILSVSLEEGDAYVDDDGIMQMNLKIYAYDQYDMVDIANLKVGDTIVRYDGNLEVTSKEQDGMGAVLINGGLENDGFNLVTDEDGVFYEMGYNDVKSWYEVGEATIRVSADFVFTDSSDLELGEMIFYPGSFLIGEVTNYNFGPGNTTVRVEKGQIIEMTRSYTP